MRRSVLFTSLAMTCLAAVASAGGSGNPNPGVLPIDSTCYGATYAEWSARWWQWALAQPADANPIEDPDGDFGYEGQGGKVWFLAGTSGDVAERWVTVPSGKAIFFPLLNNVWLTFPWLGDVPFAEGGESVARAAIAADPAAVLHATIDGKHLTDLLSYRAMSPVFTTYMPDYNWFDLGYNPWGIDIPEDTYIDSVSDGYWLMLAPLSKGSHTIHFEATSGSFSLDVTYHLTVE